MGVQIAMPIVAATFITEMIMGILMRTVPQMNMFIIGIPLKVIIGLLLLVLISPMFVQMTQPLFNTMYESINELLGGVAA
jgi:flagellar biosynthetic protein FliR